MKSWPVYFFSISDFSDKKVKEESAEDFAKYLALSQKNLNQLKQRFLENVDEDLGASKKRSEKLSEIIEDLDSISNGHLEAIVVKKEKVKFQVLQNSSDEESTPKANGKKFCHQLTQIFWYFWWTIDKICWSDKEYLTFFFLNDLFLYLAIDTVFHPSEIFKMAWRFLQNLYLYRNFFLRDVDQLFIHCIAASKYKIGTTSHKEDLCITSF